MGKLAQQISGQSQVKVANLKGMKGCSEAMEPKAEERREAKMSPKARAAAERKEKMQCTTR